MKIGASTVTGRDVYGPVVGCWLCNDNWMKLTVTPKGGVKSENVASYGWWHHRFLSVAFAWFYRYLDIYNNICAGCMVLLLLQQVSPMDDAILVSFSYFYGFGEENGCF